MANWLDKYEQGGMVLKKKTKDNYGKRENPNDVKASVGPDFVGLGYNTKGRDYSPAWGGRFQNGGKLTLPEAIVYGHKDSKVKDYFDKVRKDAEKSKDENGWLSPLAGYHALEQMHSKYGAPKINTIGEDDRAYYNPVNDSMNISIPNYYDHYADPVEYEFLNELAHKVQANKKGTIGMFKEHLTKDLINTLKNIDSSNIFTKRGWIDAYEKNYDTLGTVENEAHSVIAPKLHEEYKDILSKHYNRLRGDMAMGGALPGAVGFTYARVAGSAPANGKYTKKTKASAQNGKEMAFYQNGLDFTPKSISKNGSVIKDDMGQWAHPGEVTEIDSNNITMQGVDYPVLGVSDTGDTQMMQPNQDYKFDGEKVTEYPMMQEGGWLDKYPEPMRQDATRVAPPVLKLTEREKLENAAKYDQGQKKALVNAKKELAERKKNKATKGDLNTPGSWHTEDKARLSNILPASWAPPGGAVDVFDEYINPATYVGVLTDALGESIAARDPKGIAASLALSAGAGALGLDPLGGAIKTAKGIGKRFVKPSFTSGQEAYDFINNMVSNGQEDKIMDILTKKTGKSPSQIENEFGRAIGNDGSIRDPEYIIRHANMISGKNNIPSIPKLPKSLKELDEKAGKLVSPSSSSEFNTVDSKMIARANEILKKGVGIKNKDIPIELRSKHNGELELWVNDNNPKYVTGQSKSGTIDLRPNFKEANKSLTFTDWLKGKKPTTKYDTYDPDAIPGVIKAGDFPYQSRLDLEGTGIGAEAAEALKQALNEEGLQLFSSKSHTEAGKLRYLTEFLNNRKQVVDYSDNPDWMLDAETLRDLLGGAPISKKEAKAYMNQYPVLKPTRVRFQYDNGGWLNKYK